ncbi:maleylacetate reductase [Novosphingobium sp.]|uniref:maleylacetate reductase n=1 Tax=Novosphingobium sp. TaxID=1874826 RepID=UPI002B4A156B|nr:maleylacetate reductase [Novosphingobium sp.]HKR91770.1 maleylacetate reductase [Novosphingobium sp.]
MSVEPFTYQTSAYRVLFGSGILQELEAEIARLGVARAMVLSTPQQTDLCDTASTLLESRYAARFTEAAMHTPVAVTERALAVAKAAGVDGFVAVGGGSTTGLGKALALRTGFPVVAVPTTYAGSEMTSILGQTEQGEKTTLRDAKVLPRTVLYDVDLTKSLPPLSSALSGLNAMAHAVEALYARNRNPVVNLMAEEACRALMEALPAIVAEKGGSAGREGALYGAWLCGICLEQTEMGVHHKLCHTLGGSFDLPHAETHAVMLPHTLAYNADYAPEALDRLARAFGGADPLARIYELLTSLGGPVGLRDLGMPEAGLERALDLALAKPYPNPRPLERAAMQGLLARAWAGEPPAR